MKKCAQMAKMGKKHTTFTDEKSNLPGVLFSSGAKATWYKTPNGSPSSLRASDNVLMSFMSESEEESVGGWPEMTPRLRYFKSGNVG